MCQNWINELFQNVVLGNPYTISAGSVAAGEFIDGYFGEGPPAPTPAGYLGVSIGKSVAEYKNYFNEN